MSVIATTSFVKACEGVAATATLILLEILLEGFGQLVYILVPTQSDHVMVYLGSYNCSICHTQLSVCEYVPTTIVTSQMNYHNV